MKLGDFRAPTSFPIREIIHDHSIPVTVLTLSFLKVDGCNPTPVEIHETYY